jgi:hypothetical protein
MNNGLWATQYLQAKFAQVKTALPDTSKLPDGIGGLGLLAATGLAGYGARRWAQRNALNDRPELSEAEKNQLMHQSSTIGDIVGGLMPVIGSQAGGRIGGSLGAREVFSPKELPSNPQARRALLQGIDQAGSNAASHFLSNPVSAVEKAQENQDYMMPVAVGTGVGALGGAGVGALGSYLAGRAGMDRKIDQYLAQRGH